MYGTQVEYEKMGSSMVSTYISGTQVTKGIKVRKCKEGQVGMGGLVY